MACGWNVERPKVLERSGNLRRESQGEMFAPSHGGLFLDFPERCDRLRCAGNPIDSLSIEWSDGCLHGLDVKLGSLCEYELLRCLPRNIEHPTVDRQQDKHELCGVRTPQQHNVLLENRGQEHMRRKYRWACVELHDGCRNDYNTECAQWSRNGFGRVVVYLSDERINVELGSLGAISF